MTINQGFCCSMAPAARKPRNRFAGFSLMELMISVALLTIITGAIFSQINQMQKKSQSEALKLDLTQQAREFLDQTVRDLHMAGYPNSAMYAPPGGVGSLDYNSTLVAAGLARVSPTEILMEGDVNTDGTVYSVDISYLAADPNDPKCPCIRRSAARKQAAATLPAPLHQPVAPVYTETELVMPPGAGANQSGENLFAYYDLNGNPVNVGLGVDISTPAGQTTISQIKTVKINLSLFSVERDMVTRQQVRTSMSATARLN
jgi:type II secretory pathway pseudopilin PulG